MMIVYEEVAAKAGGRISQNKNTSLCRSRNIFQNNTSEYKRITQEHDIIIIILIILVTLHRLLMMIVYEEVAAKAGGRISQNKNTV